MFKILKAVCAAAALLTALPLGAAHGQDAKRFLDEIDAALKAAPPVPDGAPLALPLGGSAQWLDSLCRAARVVTNPQDFRFSSDLVCRDSMSAVWQTAVATAEITGVPLVCSTVPVQAEVLEIEFLAYGQKLVRTDPAAFTAAGSAGKVALAAFMQAYPCK